MTTAAACLACCLPSSLQSGMARLPGNPSLLVMYANFWIVHSEGQAARTQLQLAQKSNPSLLDKYNMYVAQQLSKQMQGGEQGPEFRLQRQD